MPARSGIPVTSKKESFNSIRIAREFANFRHTRYLLILSFSYLAISIQAIFMLKKFRNFRRYFTKIGHLMRGLRQIMSASRPIMFVNLISCKFNLEKTGNYASSTPGLFSFSLLPIERDERPSHEPFDDGKAAARPRISPLPEAATICQKITVPADESSY